MLVEPELEVHEVDREGVAAEPELKIERALAIGAGDVPAVERERIAEDIFWSDETGQ